jgi:hypothetical protein
MALKRNLPAGFIVPKDLQRLVEIAAAIEDVGDPAHGDGTLAQINWL